MQALEQYTDVLAKQHQTIATKVTEKSADLLKEIKVAIQAAYKRCRSEEHDVKKQVSRATDHLAKAQKQAMKSEREAQSLTQQLHSKLSSLNQLSEDASKEAIHHEVTKLNKKLDKATREKDNAQKISISGEAALREKIRLRDDMQLKHVKIYQDLEEQRLQKMARCLKEFVRTEREHLDAKVLCDKNKSQN